MAEHKDAKLGCGLEESPEQRLARRRNAVLVRGNKEYRSGYMRAHTRVWLADQFRALRGEMSQEDFGNLVGKSKTVIGRLENPSYANVSTRTLYQIAAALDIAVVVRFVDYETFLSWTNDMSDEACNVSATPAGKGEQG
jgi:DNA-binding XRE family transcriptional regulator